jgi:Tfp pilus assembly protein PilF
MNALKAAAIIFAGWFVFAPAFHGGWLWDDGEEIIRNAVLRDPAGLEKIWISPAGADYLPLKTTVEWLEWRCWGDKTAGYHGVSVALHVLSALLFWRLLRKLGVRLAWLGGVLFAVHPLAVESVAWIAELKNTLSLPFLLLAALAYLDLDDRRLGRAGWLSLFLFLLAMLSKSSVVMFPVVILLYCWWKRGRIGRADIAASAPFFAVSLALGLVTVWFQHHRAMISGAALTSAPFSSFAGAGQSIVFYLWKCVWPAGLLPIYPRLTPGPLAAGWILPWLAIVALAVWLAGRRSGWSRGALFGLGFFAVNLLPVLGLVPMSYLDVSQVADHFAYVPMLGVIGLAAAGAGLAEDAATRASPRGRMAMAGCLALVVCILAIGGRRYAANFRGGEELWAYALPRNPDSWAVRYNLANALVQRGELAGAVEQYREALRLKPDSGESSYNLATALVQLGRQADAVGYYERALRWLPPAQLAGANDRLGDVLAQLGRGPEAIRRYEEALRLDPNLEAAESNLGSVLGAMGRLPEAVAHLERAVQLDPGDAGARNNLGNALYVAGRISDAIACYERALELRPDYPEARANLVMARGALVGR